MCVSVCMHVCMTHVCVNLHAVVYGDKLFMSACLYARIRMHVCVCVTCAVHVYMHNISPSIVYYISAHLPV